MCQEVCWLLKPRSGLLYRDVAKRKPPMTRMHALAATGCGLMIYTEPAVADMYALSVEKNLKTVRETVENVVVTVIARRRLI